MSNQIDSVINTNESECIQSFNAWPFINIEKVSKGVSLNRQQDWYFVNKTWSTQIEGFGKDARWMPISMSRRAWLARQ